VIILWLFHLGVSCTAVVLTCFVMYGCVCVVFVMCGCFGNMCTCLSQKLTNLKHKFFVLK